MLHVSLISLFFTMPCNCLLYDNLWLMFGSEFLRTKFWDHLRLLNVEKYLHFISYDLLLILEDIPSNLGQTLWFVHNGGPPHYP